jgi:hypothetical protein
MYHLPIRRDIINLPPGSRQKVLENLQKSLVLRSQKSPPPKMRNQLQRRHKKLHPKKSNNQKTQTSKTHLNNN